MVVVIGPSNTMQHSRLSAPPDATLSGMRTSYLGNLQLLRHIFGPELFMHGLRIRCDWEIECRWTMRMTL